MPNMSPMKVMLVTSKSPSFDTPSSSALPTPFMTHSSYNTGAIAHHLPSEKSNLHVVKPITRAPPPLQSSTTWLSALQPLDNIPLFEPHVPNPQPF